MDQLQQGIASQDADHHQHAAQRCAADHSSINGRLHLAILLGAKQLRNDHRAANVASKRKRDEDQRDLIAVSDRSQGIFADKLTGHQTVRDVIELLKNDAAKQGNTKFPENGLWFSHC